MMKSKVKRKDDNFSQNTGTGQDKNQLGLLEVGLDGKNKKKEVNEDLMLRLALGKKV